jgi:tRNA threonylcarbamoyladenosine biosynthesis protein TsaE
MYLPNKYFSDNVFETEDIAKKFSKIILQNSIIYLNGQVGSGKTCFIKKIAQSLGINQIASPTFSRIQSHLGKVNLIHCDIYREVTNRDIFLLEIETLLIEPWLLFIEWPVELLAIPSKAQYLVDIRILDVTERSISIRQIS